LRSERGLKGTDPTVIRRLSDNPELADDLEQWQSGSRIFEHVKKPEVRLHGKKLEAKITFLGVMPMAAPRPLNTLTNCASRCRSMNATDS
jgi:hypothetical protein